MNPPAPATRIGSFGEILPSIVISFDMGLNRTGLPQWSPKSDDIDEPSVLLIGQESPAIDHDEALLVAVERRQRKLCELSPRRGDHNDVRLLEEVRDRPRAPDGIAEDTKPRIERGRVVD